MAAVCSLLYLGYVECTQASEHLLIPVFLYNPFLKITEKSTEFFSSSFPPFLPLRSSNIYVPIEDVVVSKEGHALHLWGSSVWGGRKKDDYSSAKEAWGQGRRKAWRKGDVTRKQTQVEPGLAPHPPGISYIDSRAGHPRMRGWGLSTHLHPRDQDRGHEKVREVSTGWPHCTSPSTSIALPWDSGPPVGNGKPGQQPSQHCGSLTLWEPLFWSHTNGACRGICEAQPLSASCALSKSAHAATPRSTLVATTATYGDLVDRCDSFPFLILWFFIT